jgi:hypothetical protein
MKSGRGRCVLGLDLVRCGHQNQYWSAADGREKSQLGHATPLSLCEDVSAARINS